VKKPPQALIIDDEPQVSGFVAQVLNTDGWHVSEARTADEAFEMLKKQEWLLVFCDVVLGGTDGYTVLRRFSEQQPKARFVLIVSFASGSSLVGVKR
jgi:two-component system nitrogen regulation response regulator NtrX